MRSLTRHFKCVLFNIDGHTQFMMHNFLFRIDWRHNSIIKFYRKKLLWDTASNAKRDTQYKELKAVPTKVIYLLFTKLFIPPCLRRYYVQTNVFLF